MAKENAKKKAAGEGKDERPFEEVFAELEAVVDQLESGELSLEESLARYEAGLKSYRRCVEILDGVERRIEVLDAQARDARPLERAGGGEAYDDLAESDPTESDA